MKYEHKRFILDSNTKDPQATLQAFGEEGWELVAVSPRTTGTVEIWFFRREAMTEAERKSHELFTKALKGDLDAAEQIIDVLEIAKGK